MSRAAPNQNAKASADPRPKSATLARVFRCRRCGACCLGRGGVRLTQAEARAAAAFLNLDEAAFHRLYLRPGPPPWEVGLGQAGHCLFHQFGGLCLIHPLKPAVCRLWPFLPPLLTRESAFREAQSVCPGFRAGLTWPEFQSAGREVGA